MSMNVPIKFGADGWRGVIADAFTFENAGTEPLLRVYCEAPTRAAVQEIIDACLRFVEQFTSSGVS